jgi:hypothetical protein
VAILPIFGKLILETIKAIWEMKKYELIYYGENSGITQKRFGLYNEANVGRGKTLDPCANGPRDDLHPIDLDGNTSAPNALAEGDLSSGLLFKELSRSTKKWSDKILVLLRIQGLGFKDPTLWPFFAGERKSGSSRQRFESLLPGKKQPKLREILQIWATLTQKFSLQYLVLFCAFIRLA